MPAIIRNGHIYGASPMLPIGAGDIDYNNTSSELQSTNVQDAVDELKGIIDANPGTTYILDTDGNNITLTPSEGSVQSITAPYATTAGDASTVNNHTVATDVPSNAVFTDTTYENATTSADGLMSSTDKGKVDALGTASTKNVPTSGNASTTEVVMGNDTRLTDARNAADVSAWAKSDTKPSYTAAEVGAIATTAKGANGGVAELDSTGKVPASQLPSYVDDVLEYDSISDFPLTGETGKIYIAKDTNKTYRWSGSDYAEISESLALGETSSTAYAGNKGKANADAIAAIKDGTNIDSFSDVESAISTLQSNFQDGVDDVYNAVVAKGSTPASKSLSDVVTGIANIPNFNSGTYSATTRNAAIDMGQANTYRYVNTNSVPNTNAATYDVTSNGIKDMGATNDKRYVNVAVPNTNTGTYTFAENDTGGIKDMGATNDTRYVVATNVYNKGKADGKADHSTTYTPTSRASNNDMGQTHSYRYVNTNSVPNSNSGTQSISANGITDMGATNDKRYVNVNVANSNSGTYTYASGSTGGTVDMGATNSYRYVNATNVYNKGKADGVTTHTTTYTPTSRASNNDMGEEHTYRYVDTTGIPNSNSGTYDITSNGVKDMTATNTYRYANVNVPNTNAATYDVTSNGIKDMGATNDKRYVNVSVPNSNSGTYTPTTKSTFDMGATNSNRYVDTRSVANVNSGTYSATSNGVKDMGADNTQRYVNVNVPNSNSGTASYDSNGIKDMGATNSYRYVNINVPHPTHTTTYTPTSRASNNDMGATHSYRYVNTNSVPNSNSGTYTPAGNAIYDMGATNDKRYCDGRTAYTAGYNAKKAELTATYTPTSRSASLDMGANHTYRYVNTNSVPNSNSGTYGSVTSNGVKDMGATNSYRYCNINVPNSNSGTYTYASGSTGGTVDMGSTNSYRYVNATNVYAKGKADGKGEVGGSYITEVQYKERSSSWKTSSGYSFGMTVYYGKSTSYQSFIKFDAGYKYCLYVSPISSSGSAPTGWDAFEIRCDNTSVVISDVNKYLGSSSKWVLATISTINASSEATIYFYHNSEVYYGLGSCTVIICRLN